jgi:hypothetical protein
MVTYAPWSGYSPYGNRSLPRPAMTSAYGLNPGASAYRAAYLYPPQPYANRNNDENGNNTTGIAPNQMMPQQGSNYSNYMHRVIEMCPDTSHTLLAQQARDTLGRVIFRV